MGGREGASLTLCAPTSSAEVVSPAWRCGGRSTPTHWKRGSGNGSKSALRALPFGQAAASPTHPDSFSYEITVHDGGDARTATVDESQLTPDLASVVGRGLSPGP